MFDVRRNIYLFILTGKAKMQHGDPHDDSLLMMINVYFTDKKNPVAILCIRFACETMRFMVSSGKENKYLARDVPLLLRRCAAVARVALRWGRAMHDAKLHLAYTLDTEGHLTVKVRVEVTHTLSR